MISFYFIIIIFSFSGTLNIWFCKKHRKEVIGFPLLCLTRFIIWAIGHWFIVQNNCLKCKYPTRVFKLKYPDRCLSCVCVCVLDLPCLKHNVKDKDDPLILHLSDLTSWNILKSFVSNLELLIVNTFWISSLCSWF